MEFTFGFMILRNFIFGYCITFTKMSSITINGKTYGPNDPVPYHLSGHLPYNRTSAQAGFTMDPPKSWTAPPHTKNRKSTSTTSFTNLVKVVKGLNPRPVWEDSAIYESVVRSKPLTQENMKKHNEAVSNIRAMNFAKLATMTPKDVAFLAHKMVENRASHAPVRPTIRKGHKGGGKKKSRRSRKTRKTRKV
jgi:hypothetical protein